MAPQSAIQIEQWFEYAIGVTIFLVRFYARFKVVGFGFEKDDVFAFVSMLLWTGEAVSIYFLGTFGTYVGLTEETAEALSDAKVEEYTRGSKALFVAWLCYATLIWSLKTTVLCFYHRLTTRLREHRLVNGLAIAVAVTYVAVILELTLHCMPIQRNWQIKPYAGDQCTLYYANYLTVTTLNVLTDIGILCFIPVPIIWKVQIPAKQKILVSLLLCSGLFIITAAIIRCVLSIQNIRSIDTSGVWAIRETFVTIIAINAPCIKPLFSSSAVKSHKSSVYELKDRHKNGSDEYMDGSRNSATGSQVKIIPHAADEEKDPGINVTTMVTVQRHDTEQNLDDDVHTCSVAANTVSRSKSRAR
ncbi:sedlin protein [Stemphylium lycopersici]|uniref:Sedlin protein n=1 Tax=Stemphylium lycopersici TaxID=183478 RepID=A0A364MZT7_STELY|nr:hypothetical protein TW65_03940 [Stemphylium lycopersici]RAR00776.1 sedlin protein [Stemphylium lycopersici]RAR08219.1 sedlin protein [Stemphylium lycopersici]